MAVEFDKLVRIEKSVNKTTIQRIEMDVIALEVFVEDLVRRELNLTSKDTVSVHFECRQGILMEANITVKSVEVGE